MRLTEYNYYYFLTSQVLGKVKFFASMAPAFTEHSYTELLITTEDTNKGKPEIPILGIKGSHSISTVSNEENQKHLR